VHINRRKNGTQCKGHYPALGHSRTRSWTWWHKLCRWLELAGLADHPLCAKRARPAAACELCPPLFPLTHCAKGGITAATRRPCSRQQASDWIRWAVKQVRGDSSRFSGISAHLDSDRGARGRDDFVSAERPRCRASGAGVHADRVPCSLSRDVRGLRPLTGTGGTSKLGVSSSPLFWVASSGWVGWRPLGLGWDGEMVVRR
jgi:hypothetical protein